MPLLGWGAGGFASQVWYTYWVLGAGYGAANGWKFGELADIDSLKKLTVADAYKIKGWGRVVNVDATVGMLIGVLVTSGFLIADAGILNNQHLASEGAKVATTLVKVFSSKWGELGGFVFMFSATIALVSTQIGQLAGWPRLLADAARLCFPAIPRKFKWETQYRAFLLFFFVSNMLIVHTFGLKPVLLVQMSAVLDGLMLTPLQAIWVALGLYVVLPRMYQPEVAKILNPNSIYLVGLIIAFFVFGYFCIFQIPKVIF